MVLEGVPWMVAGGSHSPEVGRLLAYAASGGNEGVISGADLKVVPLATPGAGVQVLSGAASMRNRFPGGSSQSYMSRNVGAANVALDAQGSSGPRYDLVALIIEDPQYAGQPAPANVLAGPYVRFKVYKNVAASTRYLRQVDVNQTGYALALVKFDASDGTVTEADITDLRSLLAPKAPFTTYFNFAAATDDEIFPTGSYAPFPTNQPDTDVSIPDWATHVTFRLTYDLQFTTVSTSPGAYPFTVTGDMGVRLNGVLLETTALQQYYPAANPATTDHLFTSTTTILVPDNLKGTSVSLEANLRQTSPNTPVRIIQFDYTPRVVTIEATFYQSVV